MRKLKSSKRVRKAICTIAVSGLVFGAGCGVLVGGHHADKAKNNMLNEFENSTEYIEVMNYLEDKYNSNKLSLDKYAEVVDKLHNNNRSAKVELFKLFADEDEENRYKKLSTASNLGAAFGAIMTMSGLGGAAVGVITLKDAKEREKKFKRHELEMGDE